MIDHQKKHNKPLIYHCGMVDIGSQACTTSTVCAKSGRSTRVTVAPRKLSNLKKETIFPSQRGLVRCFQRQC